MLRCAVIVRQCVRVVGIGLDRVGRRTDEEAGADGNWEGRVPRHGLVFNAAVLDDSKKGGDALDGEDQE